VSYIVEQLRNSKKKNVKIYNTERSEEIVFYYTYKIYKTPFCRTGFLAKIATYSILSIKNGNDK
jgi:hypothetical protein